MRVMLDTNVLARLARPSDPDYLLAFRAVNALRAAGDELVIVPQCLYELWSVATRPTTKNGWGFSPSQAAAELANFRALFTVLPDVPAILPEWERLVVAHSVVGKNGHDARMAAAMLVHGVTHLL